MQTQSIRKLVRKVTATLLVAICFGAFAVPSADALGVGSLSILPTRDATGGRSWFVHVMTEGEEKRDEMTITNTRSESVTVLIFPTGYTTVKNEIVKDDLTDSLRQEPGHWVELDKTEVTVPSRSNVRVGFTIKVPQNADVGEHIGGIFIQEKSKEDPTKGTGVTIRLHIGAQMVINVPGDVERELVVSDIRHRVDYTDNRALRFIFSLENQGNVALSPVLDTELFSMFGKIDEQDGNQLQVLSRTEKKDVESKWLKRAPYFGRFVAKFDFHLGEREQFNKDGTKTMLPDKIVEATYVFWVFPWAELVYILVVIFLLYALRSIWLYVIISRRLRTKSNIYKVVKDDTLTSIASKFGIDSRVLAKFNMMRWPFEVHVGDELLIPVGHLGNAEWREQSRIILGNREILGGIFGNIFRRPDVGHLVDRVRDKRTTTKADISDIKPKSVGQMVILIADRGDTLQDIADFAGVPIDELIAINNLRAPYRLRAGQEILAPKLVKPTRTHKTKSKPASKKKTIKRRKK